ncbi:MAG: TIGR03936 family radical SAM-associated protein [Nocardioides sp.]|nr:TIGR03936 family radical SAM-associated protein [Nocardioides sp.]
MSVVSRQPPEQQPPPVQRLRVRYAKRGRLRFTSHRDFSRAFERAVFRARIPMAYSSGFNPHPRISYAGASPTGAASEAEYLELALREVLDPADVHRLLDESLPPGLDVLAVVVSTGASLSDLLQASRWHVEADVPRDAVEQAVAVYMAATEVPVERMTKKGMRTFDSRGAVRSLVAGDGTRGDSSTALDLVLVHGEPTVRADDVLSGVARLGGLDLTGPVLLTRVEQGPYDEASGTVGDPFAS